MRSTDIEISDTDEYDPLAIVWPFTDFGRTKGKKRFTYAVEVKTPEPKLDNLYVSDETIEELEVDDAKLDALIPAIGGFAICGSIHDSKNSDEITTHIERVNFELDEDAVRFQMAFNTEMVRRV